MSEDKKPSPKTYEIVIRTLFENIESPFVYMPLALFVLFIVAYPITQFQLFLYIAIVFALIAFITDWMGRMKNRKTPPVPDLKLPAYRGDMIRFCSYLQAKALNLLIEGKVSSARQLIKVNLEVFDKALKLYPDEPELYAVKGYSFKDIYWSSRGLLSKKQREVYLLLAKKSFETALELDPNNASAHNGMGNVMFYQGRFDDAIKEHEKAIELAGGFYDAAIHDKNLVLRVKNGEIPFEYYK